jgi:hypothetical protein
VRLDHLLSKEHLHTERCVRGPPPPDVGWGCSMAETLAELGAGNGCSLLVRGSLCCGGLVERGCGAAGSGDGHPVES